MRGCGAPVWGFGPTYLAMVEPLATLRKLLANSRHAAGCWGQTGRVTGTDPNDQNANNDVPVTVPARMLNELIYCPRLFYLEWVDGQWAENADVVECQRRHRTVDILQGGAPLPYQGKLREVRSLELSSETLGVAAKLDITEAGPSGGVVPVDVKKGRPRDDGTAWPPDAVQVCVQALPLREHGYACDHAEVYYAETHQRVPVDIDADLVDTTLAAIRQAREIATMERPPPPLVASPKCPHSLRRGQAPLRRALHLRCGLL